MSFESIPSRNGEGVFSKLFSFFRTKKKSVPEFARQLPDCVNDFLIKALRENFTEGQLRKLKNIEFSGDVRADYAEWIARQSNPESKNDDCFHIALGIGLPEDIRQAAETCGGNIEIVNINSPKDYRRIAECHLGIISPEYEDCDTFLHVCAACSTVPVLAGDIQPGSLAEDMNTLGFLTPVGSAAGLQRLIFRHLYDSVYHEQLAAWALGYHKELPSPVSIMISHIRKFL